MGFNPITKEPIERELTYKDMIDTTPILGDFTLFPDISNEKSFINITSRNKWKSITEYFLSNVIEIIFTTI